MTLYCGTELFRSGPISSIFIGLTVGAPPLRLYATKDVQAKIVLEILTGKFRICSAVTEPAAESDVRNITTTAERTADGKHYIVNKRRNGLPIVSSVIAS